MNSHLVEALLEAVYFFAECDDDVLDPDVSVQQLELTAAVLAKMSESEKLEFAKCCRQHSADIDKIDAEKRQFYMEVPENLGLVTE
mgnify:CR=1 FL=1